MVTDRIVEELQNGVIPWRKPWVGSLQGALNYCSRIPYHGINTLLLPKPGEYLTFKQVQEKKGTIKKGAKSHIVVYFQIVESKKKDPDTGEEQIEKYPFLRYYRVFHIEDIEGVESKVRPLNPNLRPIEEAEATVEDYLDREPFLVFENEKESSTAKYNAATDTVTVPMLSQYSEASEYYSTVFHEFVHSTAKSTRCDRELDHDAFGGPVYSREELVAEIGSAMLCNRVGIEVQETFKNSVAYIQHWIEALKNDNKMIVWAAARAEKAARYILNDNEE